MARYCLPFFFATVLTVLVNVGASAQNTGFSPEQRRELAKAEAYLNDIGTLKARFVQIASDGSAAEGELYLNRPGQMRLEYFPPTPILVIATGHNTVYIDQEMDSVTYFDAEDTPLGLFLSDTIRFNDKVTVTSVRKSAGALHIALHKSDDPQTGSLQLLFTEKPFALRQWTLTDAQGVEISVTLFDTQYGIKLDPGLFAFKRRWQGRDRD